MTQAKLPDAIVADLPTQIEQEREGADYVVITTTALKETAQRLADYRQSLGLKTFVVDVQDVYDEFNAGKDGDFPKQSDGVALFVPPTAALQKNLSAAAFSSR